MVKIDSKVILLLLVLYFGVKYKDKISIPTDFLNKINTVQVSDDRKVDEPSAELKSLVTPITNILKQTPQGRDKYADCYLIGDFYGDFADILVKDNLLKTNKAVRQAYTDAGKLTFEKGQLSSLYPNLAQTIDLAFSTYLGLESSASDSQKQYQLFKSVQWAAYEAVK